jgi:hypothetical protein
VAQIADVSKTKRFTAREWKRWQRLIGLDDNRNWADVIDKALRCYELDLIVKNVVPPSADIRGAAPHSGMCDLRGVNAEYAAAELLWRFDHTGACIVCRKPNLHVDEIGRCGRCHVLHRLGKLVTTADKLPRGDVEVKKRLPGDGKATGRSRSKASAARPAGRPVKGGER